MSAWRFHLSGVVTGSDCRLVRVGVDTTDYTPTSSPALVDARIDLAPGQPGYCEVTIREESGRLRTLRSSTGDTIGFS